MKRLLLLAVCLLSLCFLFACGGGQNPPAGGGGNPPTGGTGGTDTEYTVTVISENAHATVLSQNPVKVKAGKAATFKLKLSDTAVFRSASEGVFDYTTGMLAVENVTKDTRVRFLAEDVGYDTIGSYRLIFRGGAGCGDTVSHPDASAPIQPGTRITATANNQNAMFLGWSASAPLAQGGRLLSEERSYSFDLAPQLVQPYPDSEGQVQQTLRLFANYAEENVYYYDPNGGAINESSPSLASGYSTFVAEREGELLRVALSEREMQQLGCASLFYDDGTFTREGYVLIEYNTKADGSGEGYSLGSKFPMQGDEKKLYCIWAKVESDACFTYTNYNYFIPSGISAANVPGWDERGVQIRSYSGSAETLVIPETLGGKPVISIASGAFNNCTGVKTLVLSKNLLKVEDGAFKNFASLETVYYSDSIYDIGNAVLDGAGYANLKHFYVNATTPPRFSTVDGAFARKLCRVMANADSKRIIMIAGSSSRQGFSTPYLEGLLDQGYTVINFGTTRTVQGFMYLEAMQHYANENDIILYAPENSSYMMGEGMLYWKTLREMEGMYNIFRYIDISGYSNVFGAFSEYNSGIAEIQGVDACYAPRYGRAPQTYEEILDATADDLYGDYQHAARDGYRSSITTAYQDCYVITLNNRFKSRLDFGWDNKIEDYWKSDNWKDASNESWCNIDDAYFVNNMNRAIRAAQSTGAKVYFSFCPVDASRLCSEALADIDAWCASYESFIESTYAFDGILGNAKDYIFHHEYFYDNAFHPNDYGRTFRTYQVYKDLCVLLEKGTVNPIFYVGMDGDIRGCRFETDYDGVPNFPAFPG